MKIGRSASIARIRRISYCLDFAEAAGLEEDDIKSKLAEYGIDEDILEIEESDIEYLQSKLRHCESSTWDSTVETLRNARDSLTRLVAELKEKNDLANINIHVKSCEAQWKQIDSELQQLFQELKELSLVNNNNENEKILKNFSISHEKELSIFIEQVSKIVGDMQSGGKKNGNCNEKGKSTQSVPNQMSEKFKTLEEFTELEHRLTVIHYEKLVKAMENDLCTEGKILGAVSAPVLGDSPHPECDLVKYQNYALTLSELRAQLQIKEKVVLQIFEHTKAQRESWLEASVNLLHILQKQSEILDLAAVVKSLQKQESNIIQELLSDCYERIQQEGANMSARIKYLEDTRHKFETFLSDQKSKQNTLPEELGKLFVKYIPAEQQSLQDMIIHDENKVQLSLEHQKIAMINSKKKLLEVDKIVTGLGIDVNSTVETLSQIEEAFKETFDLLQTQKENENRLRMWASDADSSQRLWWVYFLTDIKKLKEMKDQIEYLPESNPPGTPSFVSNYPCFTSTPKRDEPVD